MFYTYCYISRKLDSKKMTFHSQSRVYPLSFILNFRTGPGPVLSLFGLKDRRTGPSRKARTVDTLMSCKASRIECKVRCSMLPSNEALLSQ